MTTILFAFIIAFGFSLVADAGGQSAGGAPRGRRHALGEKGPYPGDPPERRLAICVSFFLALVACIFFMTLGLRPSDSGTGRGAFAVLGGLIVFGMGLFDDFHRLGPRIKFLFQILAASLAYYGGVRIEGFAAGGIEIPIRHPELFRHCLLVSPVDQCHQSDRRSGRPGRRSCLLYKHRDGDPGRSCRPIIWPRWSSRPWPGRSWAFSATTSTRPASSWATGEVISSAT